jgi:hypothetical protein
MLLSSCPRATLAPNFNGYGTIFRYPFGRIVSWSYHALSVKLTSTIATIRLAGDILEVIIYECSLHSSMWLPSPFAAHTAISYTRASMLQRLLVASRTYARTLLEVPPSKLHSLSVPAWAGWFYSTLLVVKVALLRQTGQIGSRQVSLVPHAIGEFLPDKNGGSATADICKMTSSLAHANIRDGSMTTEEVEFVSIFESFIAKLKTAAPNGDDENCASPTKPFLKKVATCAYLPRIACMCIGADCSYPFSSTRWITLRPQEDDGRTDCAPSIPGSLAGPSRPTK